MHDAVLEALEVPLAVERLQRVARVVLERAEERLEAELLGVRAVVELLDEVRSRTGRAPRARSTVLDEVVELLLEVVEEDRVLVDVLQEVLARAASRSLSNWILPSGPYRFSIALSAW